VFKYVLGPVAGESTSAYSVRMEADHAPLPGFQPLR
jgi:hypothetical protein